MGGWVHGSRVAYGSFHHSPFHPHPPINFNLKFGNKVQDISVNEIIYTNQTALSKTIRILLSAFVHISTNWTNKGYKFKNKSDPDGQLHTCVIGAIDIATLQHLGRHQRDDDLAVIILNTTALETFHCSAISVNDDLGYQSVVKLFALSIERAFDDATRIGPGLGRIEYRAVGGET
jgi:hypothetical protein